MALDTQQKSAELAARLDRLPFSKWHRNLFVLCFLDVMFDACDFALFGNRMLWRWRTRWHG